MRKIKHGLCNTKAYRAWIDAKSRCYNPTHKEYSRYGAVGITMQDSMINDPVVWCNILGEAPITKEMPSRYWSVDRINPCLGYTESNIKWSTSKEQVQNRKKNRNNTSGFSSVCINTDRNGKTRVHVYWSLNNKGYGKSFNASVLGIMQATKLAVQFRENKIQELNNQGENYTQWHGKEKV